ncbi:MAG TPA: YggT family protein [Rhabdochlamydiaceae bacterium]|nr:YggT family protein [Rhabdochlamydiaceae bacterium]HSX13097.1 YggT family protein [Chlamydiales bacterium]
MVPYTIHLIFLCYTILLFVRVVGSWFPKVAQHSFMRFVIHYTDPYLGIFRRLIPPIGGALDLSPLLGFFVLQMLEQFLLRLFS